jgi:hypothetical protein
VPRCSQPDLGHCVALVALPDKAFSGITGLSNANHGKSASLIAVAFSADRLKPHISHLEDKPSVMIYLVLDRLRGVRIAQLGIS